jgi:AraC-like DNA-binding protein
VGAYTQVYDDAESYAAALRPAAVQITVTQPGQFAANLTDLALEHVSLRRCEEILARIAHVELAPGNAVFTFLAGAGHGVFFAGNELQRNAIVRHAAGRDYYQRTMGHAPLASISLHLDDLADLQAATGFDARPPRCSMTMLPSAHAMQRLQRLHAVAIALVAHAPEVLRQPGAAHGLEQSLIEALHDCLDATCQVQDSVGQLGHEGIMRRFAEALEASSGITMFLPEICAAIGVSARTLRACCHEHLGMGPKHFLMLRSMNLVRHALLAADNEISTVTQLATEFGFWELGRFAVTYRELYGEAPSATLRRGSAPAGDGFSAAGARNAAVRQWVPGLGQAKGHAPLRSLSLAEAS